MAVRVAIIDDHETLRAGVRHLLAIHDDIEVVGEARDLQSGIAMLAHTPTDVVVLDLNLPDGNGLELAPQLRKSQPEARILVFSAAHGPEWANRAIEQGCSGYMDKTAPADELPAAIRAVYNGRRVLSVAEGPRSHLPVLSVNATLGAAFSAHNGHALNGPAVLSGREQGVLTCIARGLTNQQAADELLLSVKTVETYRSRLTRKLGLRSRAELYGYAREAGLLS